jgi:nucleotide-binding universal stress UspA family protein
VEEGRLRAAAVAVVHAGDAEGAGAVLDAALEGIDVTGLPALERHLVTGGAAGAILEVAQDAQLVVVGSRGGGGFAGLALGSVSHHVTHHARCPVVVVRTADQA